MKYIKPKEGKYYYYKDKHASESPLIIKINTINILTNNMIMFHYKDLIDCEDNNVQWQMTPNYWTKHFKLSSKSEALDRLMVEML